MKQLVFTCYKQLHCIRNVPRLFVLAIVLNYLLPTAGSAQPSNYDTYGSLSGRGTLTYSATSLGAFTSEPDEFAFAGEMMTGDFASTLSIAAAYGDPNTPASANPIVVSYPNGTGGLITDPLTLSVWLPSPLPDGTGQATLFTFNGAEEENYSFTYKGSQLTFTGSEQDVDPATGESMDVGISGAVYAGTGGGPDTVTLSLSIRENDTGCAGDQTNSYLWDAKLTDVAVPTSPVPGVSTNACVVLALPEPSGWTTLLPALVALSVIGGTRAGWRRRRAGSR